MEEKETTNRFMGFLNAWYERPIVLASSSDYRFNKMLLLGFKDIQIEPVPDVVEDFAQKQWEAYSQNHSSNPADPYFTSGPIYIARRKVEYILGKENHPSDDVSVCAFDTVPMRFSMNGEESPKKRIESIWKAEQLNKPKNIEEAKKMVRQTLETVLRGNLDLLASRNTLISHGYSADLLDETVEEMKKNFMSRLIKVKTGGAIRLAGTNNIETFSAEVDLELRKVYAGLDTMRGMEFALLQLTDQIIKIMSDTGTNVTRISGGIDYHNPAIMKLLDINEVGMDVKGKASSGIYKGMPLTDFFGFLRRLAEKKSAEISS